jgi:GntR family transcriptional repressor for pyruvate dehydrogenase complex
MNEGGGLLKVDVAGDALFRPVRAGNAFEETVSRLLQAIRLGIVPPGDALPAERDLAMRFSVSRDTVRDAIRSLSDAGFLVSRRGRYGGTFVVDAPPPRVAGSGIDGLTASAPPTAEEIEDVLALRDILEVGAARSAPAPPRTSKCSVRRGIRAAALPNLRGAPASRMPPARRPR